MKFETGVVAVALASLVAPTTAFQPTTGSFRSAQKQEQIVLRSTSPEVEETTEPSVELEHLTADIVSKLRFREVERELVRRDVEPSGTFTSMKTKLMELTIDGKKEEQIDSADVHVISKDALNSAFKETGIAFEDVSDPDFDFNSLLREISSLSEKVHWKTASRRFKQLMKRFGKGAPEEREIPEKVFTEILTAYMQSRLHAARAAEPARRAMEEMIANGYMVPSEIANSCIKDCMGFEKDGSHEGFGGIDTALAMLAAVELSEENPTPIFVDTYEKLITSLANEGSIDDALQLLRKTVVDRSDTPSLKVFADVASACVEGSNLPEKLMTGLAYVKATGYELDNIASTVDGRSILAAGVIAAEKMGNIGLGLRFLTAASKAEGCEPDRGDTLVANLSPASQRACTIIHRRAILKACENGSWKLAVKLLELMLERGLTPSPSVWRNVVVLNAKEEKSKKATALLLDWVDLYKQGRAEKPPLRVFNTVVNACEVCGEEELTVRVLDAMKETHDTEGNLITFNIALKRLAKQGNTMACEGIIIGMLQGGIEPSVVTYTTAIASCVADPKKSDVAAEWIKRMKSRLVRPNVITYNTAFASCLDGTVEGTKRASELASGLIEDIKSQLDAGILEKGDYTNIIPNFYTRTLAKNLTKQMEEQIKSGDIDEDEAESEIRGPFLELVDYLQSDLAELAEKQKKFVRNELEEKEAEAKAESTIEDAEEEVDEELEYSVAISTHRAAMV
mmetsp:Transcript_23096/g.54537  ORF Transcript_23096/g.54537 Transcript_23096/m.54537 type:complete len:739 (+) Transcript_23096:182-2398(+)|eukprot:CAMPEP_0172385454 /NCGR_PEP_ID=MMETSP1061-20121228/3125_1 /TAXON_ID=37318 /ORGANISM="Pseudo-nitzschia pungens, Strain cf. pungens" /LENGTH=738 /DNA_ID=CAMNT_0013114491 /DNA_START=111 /DNA_END=2327 /DNA_ORIENTATION=+